MLAKIIFNLISHMSFCYFIKIVTHILDPDVQKFWKFLKLSIQKAIKISFNLIPPWVFAILSQF